MTGVGKRSGEVLNLLFSLGYLTADQAARLVEEPASVRQLRRVFDGLAVPEKGRRGGPVEAGPQVESRARAVGFMGRGWRLVYGLTPAGVKAAADDQGLHLTTATALYNKVTEKGHLVDHALLRNEFLARLKAESRDTEGRVDFVHFCGESGAGPYRLTDSAKGVPRWLKPDAIVDSRIGAGDTAPHSLYVEADTGSQMRWQVAGKIHQYAEHLMNLVASGKVRHQNEVPRVLFFSPTVRRSVWVLGVIEEASTEPGKVFVEVHERFKERGLKFAGMFHVTNLEWLRETGTLGESYAPLTSEYLGRLF